MQQQQESLWNERITTVTQIYELCQTILEAGNHAAVSGSASSMNEILRDGVASATKTAIRCWPDQNQILEQAQKTFLKKLRTREPGKIKICTEEWFVTYGNCVFTAFSQQLREEIQLTEELSRRLFTLIDEVLPLDPAGKSRMMLETALRCGASEPRLAFDRILAAFSQTPDLAQDLAPDYRYQPGLHPQTELTCCPVCSGTGVPFFTAYSCRIRSFESMFLPAKLWMKCPDCGNLYTRYFPSEFLKMGKTMVQVLPCPEIMNVRAPQQTTLHTWGEILNQIRHYTRGTDLLEIGVGEGYLIAAAQEMGYSVTAVELLADCAQETANLLSCPVLCGDFLHLSEEQTYSVITMGDVLEHLQDPVEGLKKAWRLLREDGVLWLSTPNYESGYAKMAKVSDVMWCEPFHITYFSRAGLTALLEKIGFHIERYTISNRYIDSMELILTKKNKDRTV